jgi:hypothetical protein
MGRERKGGYTQHGDITPCYAIHGFIILPSIHSSRSIISGSFHAALVLFINSSPAVGLQQRIGVNTTITIVYSVLNRVVLNLVVIACGCDVPSSNYADSFGSVLLKPVVIAYGCIFQCASCACGRIFQSASCAGGCSCQSASFGGVIIIVRGCIVQSCSCVGIFGGVIIEASAIYSCTGERYQTSPS